MTDDRDTHEALLSFDSTCPECVKGYRCRGAHWAPEAEQAEFRRKVKEALATNPRYQVMDLEGEDHD